MSRVSFKNEAEAKKAAKETELVVRGYVNAQRQMAVCTFLHTKGDVINARFGP